MRQKIYSTDTLALFAFVLNQLNSASIQYIKYYYDIFKVGDFYNAFRIAKRVLKILSRIAGCITVCVCIIITFPIPTSH